MRRFAVVVVLTSTVCAAPALAQTPSLTRADVTAAVTLPPRVGITGGQTVRLSLDDAIRLALEQNQDVEIARLDTRAAATDVLAAQGVFDPLVLPSLSYQRATTPVTSAIGGGAGGSVSQDELFGSVQAQARAPWFGSRLTFDFTSSRIVTTNQFARLNPQFPSAFGATYSQPLLRNLRIDADRRQVLLARRAQDLTDAQLTQVVMEQLTLIEQAYWEVVYSAGNVSVQAEALGQARGQVASNERQVEQGTLAPIDVIEAQTQVATFEQAAATAQQMLTEAENRLKSLILTDRDAAMWDQSIDPLPATDRVPPIVTLDEAMQRALVRRPEFARLNALAAQNDIDRQFFRDQARPRLDLVGSYTLAGLAGTRLLTQGNTNPLQNAADAALYARLNDLSMRAGLDELEPPVTGGSGGQLPEFLEGGLGSSLSTLLSRRFPTALVQMQMELPIRNRTAEANVARAEIARRSLDQQRIQLEQAVEADVRNALQRVQSAEQRLASATSAQRGAFEQYESEQRRFESGLSTVFLVLQRQAALVTARGQELRAKADLNQAIALFDRAVGGTLEQHGIALEP